MFGIQHYISFVGAILIFQLVPGAGTLAILQATARNGRSAGFAAVAGTLTGDLLFMLAAVAGLAAAMKANPLFFKLLQWMGSAYLAWIGVQLLLTKIERNPSEAEPFRRSWKYFRQAFTVSITNPKVVLFFVSFFPLFLSPGSSFFTLLVMILHVTVLSLAYQAALVLVGNEVSIRLKNLPSARKLATRIAGTALIGFGVKLGLE